MKSIVVFCITVIFISLTVGFLSGCQPKAALNLAPGETSPKPPIIYTTVPPPSSALATTPTSTTASQNQQPVEIISVVGPLQPINPGGPNVAITLKNVSNDAVVSLTATLELNQSFDFTFAVSPANPLLPDNSVSAQLTLITGGFSDSLSYPLQISGTFQNGITFVYTDQVKITEPPPNG